MTEEEMLSLIKAFKTHTEWCEKKIDEKDSLIMRLQDIIFDRVL
jgi:hypothetical protein